MSRMLATAKALATLMRECGRKGHEWITLDGFTFCNHCAQPKPEGPRLLIRDV